MKLVTPEQMKEIDRRTIVEFGVPSKVLMERAGWAVAEEAAGLLSRRPAGFRVVALAGPGNNGGDALVAARLLVRRGVGVRVFLTAPFARLSPDSALNYRRLLAAGCRPVLLTGSKLAGLEEELSRAGLVIDGIFGTGFRGPARGLPAAVIGLANRFPVPVLAIDVPSGLDGEWGRVEGEAVRADVTVTIGLPKTGLFRGAGIDHSGRVRVADIGFPSALLNAASSGVGLLTREGLEKLLPDRPSLSHKGNWGHVLVVAGSPRMPGAAALCVRSCLRAGAGLATVAAPEAVQAFLKGQVAEAVWLPLPARPGGDLSPTAAGEILGFERASLIALGPGLGRGQGTAAVVKAVVEKSPLPMVIDADGLNILAGDPEAVVRAKAPRVLTPHPGEMVRLVKVPPDELRARREEIAADFARKWGVILVLKGAASLVAGPDGELWVNPTGNPGMATAGAGDVLTGMIAGFMAQGISPLEAAKLGAYAHGLAGDLAAARRGRLSLIAGDLLREVGPALSSIFPWNCR